MLRLTVDGEVAAEMMIMARMEALARRAVDLVAEEVVAVAVEVVEEVDVAAEGIPSKEVDGAKVEEMEKMVSLAIRYS